MTSLLTAVQASGASPDAVALEHLVDGGVAARRLMRRRRTRRGERLDDARVVPVMGAVGAYRPDRAVEGGRPVVPGLVLEVRAAVDQELDRGAPSMHRRLVERGEVAPASRVDV